MFWAATDDDCACKCKVDVYTGKHKQTYYIKSGTSRAYMLLSADKVAIGSHKVIVSVCDPMLKLNQLLLQLLLKRQTKVSAPKSP